MKNLQVETEEKLLVLILEAISNGKGLVSSKAAIRVVLNDYNIAYKLLEIDYLNIYVLDNNRALQIDFKTNSINLIYY